MLLPHVFSSFDNYNFVYLASQSPRRRELLEQIGVSYELLLPQPEDDAELLEQVLEQEPPQTYVQRVTLAKWEAAVERHRKEGLSKAPILCSDTTVALGEMILGKPDDEEHAREILVQLQGRVHHVYSAVVVALPEMNKDEVKAFLRLSVTEVTLLPMSTQEIEMYIASGECMGKAGAYGIQGRMAAYVQHISGSYSGVMGLPLSETAQLLKHFGVL